MPSFVGPPGTGKTPLSQLIACMLGQPFQRIALVVCVMRLRYRVVDILTFPADLAYLCRRCIRLVIWTQFYYCEHSLRIPEFADLMTAMTAEMKSIRLVNQTTMVTHLQHCLRSSIWSKTWPLTYVASYSLTSPFLFLIWMAC